MGKQQYFNVQSKTKATNVKYYAFLISCYAYVTPDITLNFTRTLSTTKGCLKRLRTNVGSLFERYDDL